jgi:N-acetylneuraminate synthase/sialic acid synthase
VNSELHDDSRSFHVVAEIGHNHQGDVEKCMRLISAAKEAGANSVKLQKRDNRSLYTQDFYNSPYTGPHTFGATYGEHREFLEFDRFQYQDLKDFATDLDITFWATAFDIPSVDFLMNLGVPAIKIASGDLRSHFLLEYASKQGVPIIFSTGGGNQSQVDSAYEIVASNAPDVGILQCTAAYPAAYETLNLNVIPSFRERFGKAVIGYSGHENGIAIAVAAYVLGAQIIEKHFTLDRTWKGTDHAFSLEPVGLRKMLRDLNRSKLALGSDVKLVSECELSALAKMGKSVYAARELHAGHVIKENDLEYRSPNACLGPDEVWDVVGCMLVSDVSAGQFLARDLLRRPAQENL